jgi:lysophospholipase L1-like esterase
VARFFSIFDRKITVRFSIRTIILLLLSAYAIWELYWYRHVGLSMIKWHTHLMLYVYLWFFGGGILYMLGRRYPSARSDNIFLLLSTTLFILFITEAALSITGSYLTYMERISHAYASPYSTQDRTHYHVWTPGGPHWLTKPEYSYIRPTNSLGFADPEWSKLKKTGEKRILALGDSFTEGDGAPYDSSWVAIFRQYLHTSGDSSFVMNAGVCGSDPCNNYIIYKDLLQPYHPDLIIQSMGSGDLIAEILLRGGLERFQRDGTVKYRPAPWWEPIYAVSYISRIFFRSAGYTELLRKNIVTAAETESITRSAEALFDAYADLCRKNGTNLIVVLHPERGEIENGQYNYDFSALLNHLRNIDHLTIIDLLPRYRNHISQTHTKTADYFWKLDGHHNSRGYKIMGELTFENIQPFLHDSIFSANK